MLRLIAVEVSMVSSGIKYLQYKKGQQHLQSSIIIISKESKHIKNHKQSKAKSTTYFYQLNL